LGCFVAPSAPTNFAASIVSGQVSLQWTASSGATGYDIYRSSTNGGPYAVIAWGVTGTNYVDTNFPGDVPCYYVVTAVNPGDESSDSTQVVAAPVTGPIINSVSFSGGNFVIQGAGGTTGSPVCLLAATNL